MPRKSAWKNGRFGNSRVVYAVSALHPRSTVMEAPGGGISSPPPRPGPGGAERASEKTSERPHVFRVGLFLRSLKDLKDPTSALPFLYVARGCPDRSQCGFKMIEYVSRPSTTQCSVFNAQHACSTQFSIQFSISSSQCSVLSTQYPVLSTQYSVLNAVLTPQFRTQYSVLNTQYLILSILSTKCSLLSTQ